MRSAQTTWKGFDCIHEAVLHGTTLCIGADSEKTKTAPRNVFKEASTYTVSYTYTAARKNLQARTRACVLAYPAHNLKVVGSNPTPATNMIARLGPGSPEPGPSRF
jgi:hypothetical protein